MASISEQRKTNSPKANTNKDANLKEIKKLSQEASVFNPAKCAG